MKKKYNKGLYKATRFTGKVVRNKTKKNPMESVGKIPAFIYEKTVDKVLDRASFNTVKAMGYRRGDNPVLGSLCYTATRIIFGFLAFGLFAFIIRLI